MNRLHIAIYVVGLCAVGFVAGFLAGGSSSPVVGVVLPLVFGLVGGASGLAVTKSDLNKPKEVAKLAVLGMALISFSLTLWLGSMSGASVRLGESLTSILFNQTGSSSSDFLDGSNTATESVALALLRARLRALGVDNGDVKKVLKSASDEMKVRREGLPKKALDKLFAELQTALKLMETSDTYAVDINKFLLWQSTNFQSVAYAGEDVRPSQILFLGELRNNTWGVLNTPDVSEMPEEVRLSLVKLHNTAMSLEAWMQTPIWAGVSPLTEELDEFISIKSPEKVRRDKEQQILVSDLKEAIPTI